MGYKCIIAAEYTPLYFAAKSAFCIFVAIYKEILIMIVGRKEEIAELDKLYNSGRPEFVAIYGRRRVGKTFLVKQVLKERITFQHTGVSPVDQDSDKSRMKVQLESFIMRCSIRDWKGISNLNRGWRLSSC